MTRVAFFVASYRHYLKYKVDDKGATYEINDPWLTKTDEALIASDEPLDFLALSPFGSTDLKAAYAFVDKYLEYVAALKKRTALEVVGDIIDER
jgi:mannitol 2-dehydrogenase